MLPDLVPHTIFGLLESVLLLMRPGHSIYLDVIIYSQTGAPSNTRGHGAITGCDWRSTVVTGTILALPQSWENDVIVFAFDIPFEDVNSINR